MSAATAPTPSIARLRDRLRRLFSSGLTADAVSLILQRESSWRDLVALAQELLEQASATVEAGRTATAVPFSATTTVPSALRPVAAIAAAHSSHAPSARAAEEPIRYSSGFQETAQHAAIFCSMTDEAGRGGLVQAVAGSGKTTTLVEGTARVTRSNPKASMAFFAFNKSIADALRRRLPSKVVCSTLHSMCWRTIVRSRGWKNADSRVDDGRVRDAAYAIAKQHASEKLGTVAKDLRTLWSLATATLTRFDSPSELAAMAESYGASIEADTLAFHLVKDLDRALTRDSERISYDEMLKAVVEEQMELPVQADIVMIDESQDLNRLQMEVLKMLKPKRLIAVGDPHQAIYAFRGADHRAMDMLADHFGIADRLPLSVTYRCASSIVAEARLIVPQIEARPGAPLGEVLERKREDLEQTLAASKVGDVVLCRTNAPLLGALLRRRKLDASPVCLIGKEAGRALVGLIEVTARSIGNDRARVVADVLMAEAEARAAKMGERGLMSAAEAALDEASMATTLLRECDTIDEARRLIESIFHSSYDHTAINFSTIHKSKGLEAERVILLGHNLLPSRRVKASGKPTLLAQEMNLLYVAVTRSKLVLVKQEMSEDDLL